MEACSRNSEEEHALFHGGLECLVASVEVSRGKGTDAKRVFCFCSLLWVGGDVWTCLKTGMSGLFCLFLSLKHCGIPPLCVGVLARHTLARPLLPCSRRHFQHPTVCPSVYLSVCPWPCDTLYLGKASVSGKSLQRYTGRSHKNLVAMVILLVRSKTVATRA